jgi:hypothetical protein
VISRPLGRARHNFIHGQFAITVFIKRPQRGRRVGNFGFIDDSIVVGIKGANQRRWRKTALSLTFAARSSGTSGSGRAAARGPLAVGRLPLALSVVLSGEHPGREAYGSDREHCGSELIHNICVFRFE